MRNYEFTAQAKDDLLEIWCFIASDNLQAADKLEEEIYAACELLAKNPGLGHKRRDLTSEPALFWPVRGVYLIIYLDGTKPVKILRVIHGARDVSSESGFAI